MSKVTDRILAECEATIKYLLGERDDGAYSSAVTIEELTVELRRIIREEEEFKACPDLSEKMDKLEFPEDPNTVFDFDKNGCPTGKYWRSDGLTFEEKYREIWFKCLKCKASLKIIVIDRGNKAIELPPYCNECSE